MVKRIRVTVCCGTACYVLGGSELLDIGEKLSPQLRSRVDVDGVPCLGLCKDSQTGSRPFARVDGTVVSSATVASVIEAVTSRANALDRGELT